MRKYGLIGYPLTHSFSPKYFFEKFLKLQINDVNYATYPLTTIDQFPKLLNEEPELVGLNVTIPYKEVITPFLDELDITAKKVGAVNTIKISDDKLIGYNTDIYGLEQSLTPYLKKHHQKALILGTGGASKAVITVLEQLDINYQLISRNAREGVLDYQQIAQEVIAKHQLIINTTPLGTYPNTDQFPDIPYEFLGDKHLLFDLVYNPSLTSFMKKGKAKGATVVNGQKMLELQADKSWEIWNNS